MCYCDGVYVCMVWTKWWIQTALAFSHILAGQVSCPIEGTQQPAATDTNCNKARQVTVIIAIHFYLNSF